MYVNYNVEPGWYSFRAKAQTADGALQAVYSKSHFLKDREEVIKAREEFIKTLHNHDFVNVEITNISSADPFIDYDYIY